MKNYTKPTLEIAKITTNEAIAAGSPIGVQREEINGVMVPVTVYEINSFAEGSVPNA